MPVEWDLSIVDPIFMKKGDYHEKVARGVPCKRKKSYMYIIELERDIDREPFKALQRVMQKKEKSKMHDF